MRYHQLRRNESNIYKEKKKAEDTSDIHKGLEIL